MGKLGAKDVDRVVKSVIRAMWLSFWRCIDINRYVAVIYCKIKDSNLKSAILVTRGAAFRDIGNLFDAENCAKKAIDCHPDSYQPYTLMGAIYYDKGDYPKGDYWFEKAIERGAKTEDIDDEIKRVINSTKDEIKRHEAANYLLKKDPHRYTWAKSYLKNQKKET